jgi:hypothetical protein
VGGAKRNPPSALNFEQEAVLRLSAAACMSL